MTREKMLNIQWKPYMLLLFKHERMEEEIECLLLGINFDDEIVTIQPIGIDYKTEDFYANLKHISLPLPKPRKIK